ncbi:hypothetical protein Emag_006923 [Eimeria magna]
MGAASAAPRCSVRCENRHRRPAPPRRSIAVAVDAEHGPGEGTTVETGETGPDAERNVHARLQAVRVVEEELAAGVSNALMGAENRESAAPQGSQPTGTRGGGFERTHVGFDNGATARVKGLRYAPAANPFVEEGLSDLRGCRAAQRDQVDPACVMVDDDKDVIVAPAGDWQGPKKVDGNKFKRGAYG